MLITFGIEQFELQINNCLNQLDATRGSWHRYERNKGHRDERKGNNGHLFLPRCVIELFDERGRCTVHQLEQASEPPGGRGFESPVRVEK